MPGFPAASMLTERSFEITVSAKILKYNNMISGLKVTSQHVHYVIYFFKKTRFTPRFSHL